MARAGHGSIFLSNGKHPWSRGCSLNRGSNVFWSYLPIKLSRSKSSWPLSRLMSLSVILEFSAMPFKTSLSSSSPDKLRNSSWNRKRHVYCHNSKAITPFFLLRYIYRAFFSHRGKNGHTWVCSALCFPRAVRLLRGRFHSHSQGGFPLSRTHINFTCIRDDAAP